MRDKADLTDKADQLEHMVVQLQGETDTIGEWCTRYLIETSHDTKGAEQPQKIGIGSKFWINEEDLSFSKNFLKQTV